MVLLVSPGFPAYLKPEDDTWPPELVPIRELYIRSTVKTATGESVIRWVYKGVY